jgi:hypothetical protein
MLRPMSGFGQPVTATARTHPSWRSVDIGGASPPEIGKDGPSGLRQATRIAAPMLRPALAQLTPLGRSLYDIDPNACLEAAIADINARHRDAALVLVTGEV